MKPPDPTGHMARLLLLLVTTSVSSAAATTFAAAAVTSAATAATAATSAPAAPEFATPIRSAPLAAGPGPIEATPQARNIRVRGRAMTLRPDGETIPIPSAVVFIEDEDGFPSAYSFLESGQTDADGRFDITFHWDPGLFEDDEPDIVVMIGSKYWLGVQDAVEVIDPDINWLEEDDFYKLQTSTVDDYTGTDLDVGTILASTERKQAAFYLYTLLMRSRQWLIDHFDPGFADHTMVARFPTNEDAGSILTAVPLQIQLVEGFDEYSLYRELGREFHRWRGQHVDSDFCNGTCDAGDCGFCLWCAENDHDAWELGFCHWFANMLSEELEALYGEVPLSSVDPEALDDCSGALDNPLTTAGFVAALLHDIQDSAQDNHPQYAAGIDALALGYNEILTVVDVDEPATVAEFIDAFHARYPQHCEELWLTAKNCGYDRDIAAPGVPGNLTSPSHSVQSTSPDATVQFTWATPTDDMSCIDGYGYSVTAGAAAIPTAVKDMEEVTTFTTAPLAPGTWYFNLRAVDNAGRWSAGYASYGPFTIENPEPANLVFELPAGWAEEVVPRPTGDATANGVVAPASLTGNAAATYWNAAGRNAGALATSGSFAVRVYVDGAFNSSSTVPIVAGGASFSRLNRGPMTVRGGRHTYEALLDGNETIAETNENDNRWAAQWIWNPLQLAAGTPITRSAPPDRTGGWDAVGAGPALYYNCDGLRLTTTGWWNAVTVHALDNGDDYDCRLHTASSSPLAAAGGFAANAGYSARAAGAVDAVLVNRNVTGNGSWDVGVLNTSGGASQYMARHVASQTHPFGTRVLVPMAQDQLILLREFQVGLGDVGWVDILVDVAPQDGPVHVLYLDETFSTGDLLDFDAIAVTGVTGHARITTNIASDGYNCVVVYRDAVDGTGAIDVSIQIGRTPPDYRPYLSAGWHAPVVPRPASDAAAFATPAPLALEGNAATTWMNMAVINDSPASAAVSLPAFLCVDTAPIAVGNFGTLAALQINRVNNDGPYTVPGGRHTLYLLLDPTMQQLEISETNNPYGEQWIWSPLQLGLDAPVSRPVPPFPDGGFGYVRTGEPLYFNCDGLRTPVFAPSGAHGYWGAVAIMPGASSNADLRLHASSTGPKDGFAEALAASFWPTGHSDFILVDFNSTAFAAFDAGVLESVGSQGYTAQVTNSRHLGLSPNGTYGPYTMHASEIVDVHEAWLEPGVYICRLENVAGTIDWGFSLYPTGLAFHAKSAVVPGGASWQGGPGAAEPFHVQVAQAGYYAFAAWKVGSSDLAAEGSYQIVIHSGATGAPDPPGMVLRTAIAAVSPNPFNPHTAIAFDLAHAGDVQVRIMDARGQDVRVLVAAPHAAGRHQVVWDGTDGDGRAVASGVYLVQLTAGGVSDARKCLLVK